MKDKETHSLLVYEGGRLPIIEHPAKKMSQADNLVKVYAGKGRTFQLKRNKGFQHGKPIRWKWNAAERQWDVLAVYDQYAIGKSTPKRSEARLFTGERSGG